MDFGTPSAFWFSRATDWPVMQKRCARSFAATVLCSILNRTSNKEIRESIMRMFNELLSDENGFIVSSELILIATILVIALVVGLQTVRDAVLQELGDVGAAIGAISQDYSYTGATGSSSTINGSFYVDATDSGESSVANNRNCLAVFVAAPAAE